MFDGCPMDDGSWLDVVTISSHPSQPRWTEWKHGTHVIVFKSLPRATAKATKPTYTPWGDNNEGDNDNVNPAIRTPSQPPGIHADCKTSNVRSPIHASRLQPQTSRLQHTIPINRRLDSFSNSQQSYQKDPQGLSNMPPPSSSLAIVVCVPLLPRYLGRDVGNSRLTSQTGQGQGPTQTGHRKIAHGAEAG